MQGNVLLESWIEVGLNYNVERNKCSSNVLFKSLIEVGVN